MEEFDVIALTPQEVYRDQLVLLTRNFFESFYVSAGSRWGRDCSANQFEAVHTSARLDAHVLHSFV